ncbi:hypothetical protein GGR50DRAFT_637543 [Xylaria sp. CBS 124048]|nr:hypothetical protein GGR50DRAFT_637543 [Xylaria sp. CBS 124048]
MATPGKGKTNFKTYEAATRLLAAVIATNTSIKLDYAELANHVGGGATKAAIDHRLRPIKQLAKMQAACVREGRDPGELPADKGEIQKCFGESTPAGLEWQFRDIKNLAKAQKKAVSDGGNPATLQVAGTPSGSRFKGAGAATPGTGRKRKTPSTPAFRAGTPSAVVKIDDDGSDSDPVETPTRRPGNKKQRTSPAKQADQNVAVTASAAAAAAAATFTTINPANTFTAANASDASFFSEPVASTAIPSTESFASSTQPSMSQNSFYTASVAEPVARPVTIKKDPFASDSNGNFVDDTDYMDGEV